jgi:hypothetical protein
MKTLSIVKGHHKNGVVHLSFLNEDKYLISCSLKAESSILIHDWEKNILIHSFNMNSTVQDIDAIYFPQNFGKSECHSFYNKMFKNNIHNFDKKYFSREGCVDLEDTCLICSEYEIFLIKVMNSSIKTIHIPLNKAEIKSEILCICLVKNFNEEIQEKSVLKTLDSEGVVFLTGHVDGSVNIWDEKGYKSKK